MGIIQRVASAIGLRSREPQNVAFTEDLWQEVGLFHATGSGQMVNWKTALEITTALRCGLVIADGVSTVPCRLMHKDPDTGKRKMVPIRDHPIAEMLEYQVNEWTDPLQFFETVTLHTAFEGNGYVFLNKVRGKVREMIPLKPDRVRVEQESNWRLRYYVVGLDGREMEFPAESIWHFRGPSWDGYQGLSTVKLAREALGLATATQQAHAARFKNAVNTSGVYAVKGTLDDAGYKRLRQYIETELAGVQRSGKPLIMDREGSWQPLGMSGVDAEHVKTREHQIAEICRAFGVNPIMVGHNDKTATYASAEQMFLSHVVNTVRPWHVRYKRSMARALLTREEVLSGFYFHFFDSALLRGAAKDRADYYAKMFGVGAFSPNQILEFEDMDGFEGGDTHWVPMNMQDPANPTPKAIPAAAPANDDEADPMDAAARKLRHALGRTLSKENEELVRGARDNLDQVLEKVEDATQEGWQQP